MSNYLSRAELEEISEGLIRVYATQHRNKVVQSIDIEHFITDFLKLKIEYRIQRVYSDATGHLSVKCQKCKSINILNLAYFRKIKCRKVSR